LKPETLCKACFVTALGSMGIGSLPAKAAPACPASDFSRFFEVFAESTALQKAFVVAPLTRQQLDRSAEPDPKPVLRTLRPDQLRFPLIPPKVEPGAQSLKLRIDEVSPRRAKVALFKDYSDYQVMYFFEKKRVGA
jgi:hypothetical protein